MLAFRPHWDKQALGHFAVYVLHVLHQFWRLQTLPRGLMYKTVNQPAFIIPVIKLGYEPPVQLPNQHPSRRARSSKHFITDDKGGIHTNYETQCCSKLPTCKQMDLTWAKSWARFWAQFHRQSHNSTTVRKTLLQQLMQKVKRQKELEMGIGIFVALWHWHQQHEPLKQPQMMLQGLLLTVRTWLNSSTPQQANAILKE